MAEEYSVSVPENPTKADIAEARGIIRTTEEHKGKLTKGMQLDYDYAVQIMINSGSSNKASIGKKQQVKDTTRRGGPLSDKKSLTGIPERRRKKTAVNLAKGEQGEEIKQGIIGLSGRKARRHLKKALENQPKNKGGYVKKYAKGGGVRKVRS